MSGRRIVDRVAAFQYELCALYIYTYVAWHGVAWRGVAFSCPPTITHKVQDVIVPLLWNW